MFGWSSGGLVALALAMRAPGRVRGLVLGEPPLHARRFGSARMLVAYARMKLYAALGRDRAAVREFLRSLHPDAFDRLPAARREAILGRAPSILAEITAGTGEQWREADLAARVTCPTAFVVGGASPRFFGAIAEHFAPIFLARADRARRARGPLPARRGSARLRRGAAHGDRDRDRYQGCVKLFSAMTPYAAAGTRNTIDKIMPATASPWPRLSSSAARLSPRLEK